jgi:hypothetical protein
LTRTQLERAVSIEVGRGKQALSAAELLFKNSLYADAVSRAYYAALHYARALLMLRGLEPRTHAGVHRLLSLEYVHSGEISPGMAHHLSILEKQRSDADYASESVFDQDSAALNLEHARAFIASARAIIDRASESKRDPA